MMLRHIKLLMTVSSQTKTYVYIMIPMTIKFFGFF